MEHIQFRGFAVRGAALTLFLAMQKWELVGARVIWQHAHK